MGRLDRRVAHAELRWCVAAVGRRAGGCISVDYEPPQDRVLVRQGSNGPQELLVLIFKRLVLVRQHLDFAAELSQLVLRALPCPCGIAPVIRSLFLELALFFRHSFRTLVVTWPSVFIVIRTITHGALSLMLIHRVEVGQVRFEESHRPNARSNWNFTAAREMNQ